MKLIMLGNRGSRPLGASENSPWAKYGGDTTSMLLVCDNDLVVIDTGSGFYKMQYTLQEIMKRDGPYDVHIFYSHYHDDHTAGLPQSFLLFGDGNTINFYGPNGERSGQGKSLDHIVGMLAGEPRNPNLMGAYQAAMHFNSLPIVKRSSLTIGDNVEVSTLPVNHGNIKTLGYRIDHDGQSAVIISDMHHSLSASGKPAIDARITDFARNANVLVTDSHFTDAEFEANPKMCQAFGHSTGEHGVRLCHHAGIPVFVAHHHNPAKIDAELDQQIRALTKYGRRWGVDVVAAKPSLCIDLSKKGRDLIRCLDIQDIDIQERYEAIAAEL